MNIIGEAIALILFFFGILFVLVIWFTVPLIQQEVNLLHALLIIPGLAVAISLAFVTPVMDKMVSSTNSRDSDKT